MYAKVFEIRDEGTYIPVVALSITETIPGETYHFERTGYGALNVILVQLEGPHAEYDPFSWNGGRTMREAHRYIKDHFSELCTGDVVDVQYILGETDKPKKPEYLGIRDWEMKG